MGGPVTNACSSLLPTLCTSQLVLKQRKGEDHTVPPGRPPSWADQAVQTGTKGVCKTKGQCKHKSQRKCLERNSWLVESVPRDECKISLCTKSRHFYLVASWTSLMTGPQQPTSGKLFHCLNDDLAAKKSSKVKPKSPIISSSIFYALISQSFSCLFSNSLY